VAFAGVGMPRCFFVLEGQDEKYGDSAGTMFADQTSALAFGARIMRELKDAGGYDEAGWILHIRDERDGAVASLPFAKVAQFN
jgi:hypothetical protein